MVVDVVFHPLKNAVCGDGKLEESVEDCDDGNKENDDACAGQ